MTMPNIIPIYSKDGKIYWVDSTDKLYIQRLRAGQYQGHNWKFAQTLIDSWVRAIDVGSNNACNAINYAEQFQTVECFEPTSLAQQLWTNTVRDNSVKNCNLYKNAVGENIRQSTIIVFEHNGGHNHLDNQEKWIDKKPIPRRRKVETVEVKTIDSYNFSDVGFIKIDVEGYEKFVLEGAVNTINACRPTIQLEIVPSQCKRFKYSAVDLINWIRSWNYTVVSRNLGILDGNFTVEDNRLLYNGQWNKGEMDLWFQPNERVREQKIKKDYQNRLLDLDKQHQI